MENIFKKVISKQFQAIACAVLDDFVAKKFPEDSEIGDDELELIKTYIEDYKNELKEGVKNETKKGKGKNGTKGTRKPTRYNKYMKQKMKELKESEPELSNNEKFSKIAAMWKEDKATWSEPEEEDSA